MNIGTHLLNEFIPLGIVILLGAVFYVAHRLRSPSKAALARSNYVVFEAEPVNLPNIVADLADNGWHLTSTQATATAARLYRFEKGGAVSACLSTIFDFETSMPRTANRTSGTHSLIKVAKHGSGSNSQRQ
jgi:hypothetical protein